MGGEKVGEPGTDSCDSCSATPSCRASLSWRRAQATPLFLFTSILLGRGGTGKGIQAYDEQKTGTRPAFRPIAPHQRDHTNLKALLDGVCDAALLASGPRPAAAFKRPGGR